MKGFDLIMVKKNYGGNVVCTNQLWQMMLNVELINDHNVMHKTTRFVLIRHLFDSGDHGFIRWSKISHCAQRMNIKIRGTPLFSPFTLVLCLECGCYVKSTNTLSFVHRKNLGENFLFFVLCSFFKKNCLFVLVCFQCLFFSFLMFFPIFFSNGNCEGFSSFLFSY